MISARRIIVVCVMVLVVAVLFAGNSNAALWDIISSKDVPIHPLLSKIRENKMLANGVDMRVMLLEGESVDIDKIVEYYLKVLEQKGWQLKNNIDRPNGSVSLRFQQKDMRIATLDFNKGEERNRPGVLFVRIVYTLGSIENWGKRIDDLSSRDMIGIDPPPLQEKDDRYPGSERRGSVQYNNGYTTTSYMLAGNSCIECVADFYTQKMADKGWKLVSTRHANKDALNKSLEKLENKLVEYSKKANVDLSALLQKKEFKAILKRRKYPDEIKALRFIKAKDVCIVNLVYKKSDPSEPTPFDLAAESVGVDSEMKDLAKEMFRELAKKKPMLSAIVDPEDDRIEIGIAYMPGMMKRKRR